MVVTELLRDVVGAEEALPTSTLVCSV